MPLITSFNHEKLPNKWLNKDWVLSSPFVQKDAQKSPTAPNLLARR